MTRLRPALILVVLLTAASAAAAPSNLTQQEVQQRLDNKKWELYHPIKTDAQGNIIPWFSPEPAKAFDHAVRIVWKWWQGIQGDPRDPEGVPYYMLHQVWRPAPDFDDRGIGGDQVAMAISSWDLLHAYTGDPALIANMKVQVDYVLTNKHTGAKDQWPGIPYPYNTKRFSPHYDGIMRGGPGYIEPDKAGSLAYAFLTVHKKTGERKYLEEAVRIANVLARKTRQGDYELSPLPYRVRAWDGAVAASYTSNWIPTLLLFEELQALGAGDRAAYKRAHGLFVDWLRAFPLKSNKWGPFFEDVDNVYWSDTQTNAATFAMYVMDRRDAWGSTWRQDARSALDWAWKTLGNDKWQKYGVRVINEQTSYRVPGQSHTSRQASMELRYAELTGDAAQKTNAVRALAWTTYHIDHDGKNRYFHDDVWLTDGYGDYVRHVLRAMAAAPELVPADQDHILRSSTVVQDVKYADGEIAWRTFDKRGEALLRVGTFAPTVVTAGGKALKRVDTREALDAAAEGWTLGAKGDLAGVVRVKHGARDVRVAAR